MRLKVFILVSILHLVVGVIYWVFFFSMAMAAIDGEGSSVLAMRIAYVTLQVLYPLSAVLDLGVAGVAARVALFLGNSFAWGAIAVFVWSLYQRAHGTSRRAHVVGQRGAV